MPDVAMPGTCHRGPWNAAMCESMTNSGWVRRGRAFEAGSVERLKGWRLSFGVAVV